MNLAWVQQLERYMELETGAALSGKSLNAANTAIAAYGNTGVKSAEATFQNARGARKAQIATYRPGAGVLIEDDNQAGVRVRAVNLWRPSRVVPAAGFSDATVAPWLDHVTAIFGDPGDPAREHFLDFFGFAMQNPGVKINHALVVLGMQGVGKDTAFAPIFEALGEHNVGTIKPEDLAGQFTPFLENQIVCVQEMSNFTKREVYNRLKDWIAAPPRFVTINKKNQHPYTIPNTQIWVFFTNYDDAIALDEDDRRFWVHRAPAESVPSDAYFTKLHQWYGAGGVECVYGWLKQRDVSAFNPMARPPATDAKRLMLDRSQPAPLKWLRSLFQEGAPLHGRSVIKAGDLLAAAGEDFSAPNGVDKYPTAALKAEGYKPGHRLRLGANMRQLWIKDGSGLLAQLPPNKLRERYEAEMASQLRGALAR